MAWLELPNLMPDALKCFTTWRYRCRYCGSDQVCRHNDADVLNMSFGGSGESQLMKTRSTMPIKGVVMQQLGTKTEMRLLPTLWAGCSMPLGKKPYSNFGAGWISPLLVAVQQVKFCKKPLTPGEAVFLGFKAPAAAPRCRCCSFSESRRYYGAR